MASPTPTRILIADDQPDVLEAMRLLFKHQGYKVEVVNSPARVVESLQTSEFDLLIMDLNYTRDTTSGEEGLDLLARVQSLDATIRDPGLDGPSGGPSRTRPITAPIAREFLGWHPRR